MGLPKGTNNGAHGVKGKSGRKSEYQEKADAQFLADFFFTKYTKEEIREMVSEGKAHSVSDQMLAKAMVGNEKYTLAVFNKLFPDLSKSQQEHKFDFSDLIKGENNV